jgi:hypothetical protein
VEDEEVLKEQTLQERMEDQEEVLQLKELITHQEELEVREVMVVVDHLTELLIQLEEVEEVQLLLEQMQVIRLVEQEE